MRSLARASRPRLAPRLGIAAVAALLAASLGAAQASSGPSTRSTGGVPDGHAAVLLRGTFSARGLPFFGPNAIEALHGEYLLGVRASDAASAIEAAGVDGERRVDAWYTRDRVVLSPEWKSASQYGSGALIVSRPQGPVLCLKGEGYSLFLEFASETAEVRSFAQALGRRFAVFFRNASSDAELSFPAVIEY